MSLEIADQTYIQINYDRNFTFIDKIGSIIDQFIKSDSDLKTDYNTHLNNQICETLFESKKQNLAKIKFNTSSIWFEAQKDFNDDLKKKVVNNTKLLCSSLDIKEVSRIGLRKAYVYKFENQLEYSNFYPSLFPKLEDVETGQFNVVISPKNKDFKCLISISSVIDPNNQEYRTIIDVDCYKEGKILVKDIEDQITKMNRFVVSDQQLKSKIKKEILIKENCKKSNIYYKLMQKLFNLNYFNYDYSI